MTTNRNAEYLFKIIIIGDSGVGKSCLITRYTRGDFNNQHRLTIGAEFSVRDIAIDDSLIKMHLWDTAGEERFQALTTCYFRGADGIIMAYDITNAQSFENIKKWYNQVRLHAKDTVNLVLVGTKCDLEERRQVSTEEGKMSANILGCLSCIETSSKLNENVDEAFILMATKLKQQFASSTIGLISPQNTIILNKTKPNDAYNCYGYNNYCVLN